MAHYSIAIVGAGPAGYFTAQALQNAQSQDRTFAIDLFERLPTMWGGVRLGVAPDHPKIKTVAKGPLGEFALSLRGCKSIWEYLIKNT